MKLLIISNMAHYKCNGHIVGWGPTIQEISHLSQLFEEVRHIACMYPEEAPQSALAYSSTAVRLIPVPPAGGERLRNKLEILRLSPLYVRTVLKELRAADVVHVRCPANISLLAILLLAIVKKPRLRWVKYAGNWSPTDREAWSYRFQRWWLRKRFHRALVTINGSWPNQPTHTRSFLNPCLTDDEIRDAEMLTSGKQLTVPVRLLFAGRIERAKGVGRALQIVSRLKQKEVQIRLELVGDGSERSGFEKMAASLGCADLVTFHGWLPRPALAPIYRRSHILLFPTSSSEGWPKVLSEAMAYGVVPIAGNVSCVPQFLEEFDTGRCFDPDDIEGFAEAIAWYASNVHEWKRQSNNGMKAAGAFSYSNYVRAVTSLLSSQYIKPVPTPISGNSFARD